MNFWRKWIYSSTKPSLNSSMTKATNPYFWFSGLRAWASWSVIVYHLNQYRPTGNLSNLWDMAWLILIWQFTKYLWDLRVAGVVHLFISPTSYDCNSCRAFGNFGQLFCLRHAMEWYDLLPFHLWENAVCKLRRYLFVVRKILVFASR